MNAKTLLLALTVGGLPVSGGARQFSIESSSNTQKLEEQLEKAADKSGEGAQEVFDGSRGGKGGFQLAAEAVAGLFRGGAKAAAAIPAKGLKLAKVPAVKEILSDLPGKKHGNLDTLEVAPDGSMYRMRKEPQPIYKFWKWFDNTKIIEQAAPAKDGAMFNKKGEFVGDWNTVLKAKADGFKVAADKASGKNTIFTFERKGSGTEIAKDGKYVTTLGGNDLREIKIGKDAKLYARYEKGADDVIVSIDPATKAQTTVAKVAAEYKSWKEWVSERGYYDEVGHYETREGRPGYYEWREGTPGRYDSDGDWHEGSSGYNEWHPGTPDTEVWVHDYDRWVVTDPAHYETRTSRTGLTKFEANADGKVLALFKGQVIDPATQQVVSADNVQNFNVDGRGTLYTVVNNKLAIDNGEPSQAWAGDKPLNVDDHGNLYGADGKIARRYNVTPDPSQAEDAAAPTAGAAK